MANEAKEAVASLLNENERSLESLLTLQAFLHRTCSDGGAGGGADDRDDFLRRQKATAKNAKETVSVRGVLSFVSGDKWQQLTAVLAESMERRVDTDALLPMTQDVAANEEAMGENSTSTAQRLTKTALTAAAVYAQLIGMPGALAVGLIEMNAVSALTNVVCRWKVECCGREGRSNAKTKKQTQRKGRGQDEMDDNGSGEELCSSSQPLQKTRQGDSYRNDRDDDDDEDDTYGATLVNEVRDALSPQQLVTLGLTVAREVSQVPLQTEFLRSWNMEAVAVVLDSIATVLATAQALASGRSDEDTTLATAVVEQASEALRRCILLPDEYEVDDNGDTSDDDEDDDTPASSLQKRHDTVVAILRGLYPVIVMKDALPKGEAGKLAAAGAASEALESLIQEVNEDIQIHPHRWPSSVDPNRRASVASTVPSTVAPSSVETVDFPPPSASSDPATPKTASKRLRTASTTGTTTRRGSMTPKLKARTPISTPFAPQTTMPDFRPGPVLSALVGMLQQLATATGLEKASVRTPTVETLHRCVRHLPLQERAYFLQFLVKLCHSKVPVHRLVAAELAGCFLTDDWLWSEHGNADVDLHSPAPPRTPGTSRSSCPLSPLIMTTSSTNNLPLALFGALQGRLLDRAPTIRTTSATALTKVCRRLLEARNDTVDSVSMTGMVAVLAEGADALVDCLRLRAVSDEKATVRRATCSALVELLVIGESMDAIGCPISEQDIHILGAVCQDSSMMTRRAAAEGLTRLLECVSEMGKQNRSLPGLEKAWALSTLTMVLDAESGCVTKAVELVERLVIFTILPQDVDVERVDQTGDRAKRTAWRILATLGDGTSKGASRSEAEALRVALQKSIAAATSKHYAASIFKTIHRVAVESLDETVNDLFAPAVEDQRTGVWCLFEAAMGHTKDQAEIARVIKRGKIDLDFLGTSWDKLRELFMSSETPAKFKLALQRSMRSCLQVLSQLAPLVDVTLAEKTANNLQALIGEFSLPPEIIGSAIAALTATTIAVFKNESENTQHQRCAVRLRSLYNDCEKKIATFCPDQEASVLARALFTAGELSMVGFSASDDSNGGEKPSKDNGGGSSVLARGLYERPSKQLVEFIQAFMTNYLTGREDAPTPESVRAHAFVAFGKLCLRDAGLAKKSLNILARELHDSIGQGNWMVQSNSLLVLGDLCVKYTNMVDRFLPVMAGCLQAGVTDISANALGQSPQRGSALVRKHAILLLSNLLLQDYIKWRGLLFHRFLVASVDEDDDVATLAEMVLYGPLVSKQPRLFSNHFVESLFVLNRCTAHPIYKAAAALGDGGSGISVGFDGINLTGEAGRVRRMRMYQMMLSKMSDEDKIGVTARIGKEVLWGALKSGSDLNVIATNEHASGAYEGAFNVLSDALAILTCPLIRVGKNNRLDDDIADPNVTANNAKRALEAKGRLLSNVSRKHLIEILLPILCNLKSILEKSRSPLLKDLMACLLDVYQRYKAEAQECLANDPTTLQEIEYDAQQLKKTQRKQKTPARSRMIVSADETTLEDDYRCA